MSNQFNLQSLQTTYASDSSDTDCVFVKVEPVAVVASGQLEFVPGTASAVPVAPVVVDSFQFEGERLGIGQEKSSGV